MSDRAQLLEALASLTADYAMVRVTPIHIERWIRQFDGPDGVQEEMLKELLHVLNSTYLSEAQIDALFKRIAVRIPESYGESPDSFWSSVVMIDRPHITNQSQKILLAKLQSIISVPLIRAQGRQPSPSNRYVFLDDILFTGRQTETAIGSWLSHAAPPRAALDIVVLASHTAAEEWLVQQLEERLTFKRVSLQIRKALVFENRESELANAAVLWPTQLPDDANCGWYANRLESERDPYVYRSPNSIGVWPFSGEGGRRLLEDQFTRRGVALIRKVGFPDWGHRPLGFSRRCGFGFGSMLVTHRRTANNCPLVLWWGDPTMGHPLNQWYPLFPRFSSASRLPK